jgi:tripartite-type tricarboxylate transporter receptor subunit TctC
MVEQLSGRVHFSVANSSTALPQIREGKVVALGVTGRSRLPQLPDLPTLQEQGLEGFAVASYWNGLLGPAGLPPAVAQRIAAATNKVLAMPEIRQRFVPTGNELDGSSTPQSFVALIEEDMRIWSDVARTANIRAQ